MYQSVLSCFFVLFRTLYVSLVFAFGAEWCSHPELKVLFPYGLPPGSPVFCQLPKTCQFVNLLLSFPPRGNLVCENVHVWCPVMAWHLIQGVFPPHIQCLLPIHHNPDPPLCTLSNIFCQICPNKAYTEFMH